MTQRDDQRLHGLLTAALVSDLAWSSGTVEQADRIGTLARPEMVAGFRPDVVAHSGDTIVLGEAKVDPRLNSGDFVEKLRAWHDHPPDGFSRVVLALAVPAGWRLQAEEIAARAGWSHEDLRVLEVGLPDAPLPGD